MPSSREPVEMRTEYVIPRPSTHVETATATPFELSPPIARRDREIPAAALDYPQLRFMGSKHRLLPWLHRAFSRLSFSTALDAFSGTGCVAYLLRTMGKTVTTNDSLCFATHIANAVAANPGNVLTAHDVARLTAPRIGPRFIEKTFRGIFFPPVDNKFLDTVWANLDALDLDLHQRSIAIAALCRSAIKKQPRGVFTISGLDGKYDDGRRDLRLSMREHFMESVELFNSIVISDKRPHTAIHGDVFLAPENCELVYLDPPYVPRSDDNCYIKRYHFLEGLSCYWRGLTILEDSKVKKIEKTRSPFSYRHSAIDGFERMFDKFKHSTIVLSYSSNGFPDRDVLLKLLKRHKSKVRVLENEHRYHFGTHAAVRQERAVVQEYLFIAE